MKKDIHPQYHMAKVTCSCGNTFDIGSTLEEINVEVCSQCHPFWTGEKKTVDAAGRLERFKNRFEKSKKMATGGKKKEK